MRVAHAVLLCALLLALGAPAAAVADHYSVLNVQKSASDKEIKAAYRRLAQQFHPDKVREAAVPSGECYWEPPGQCSMLSALSITRLKFIYSSWTVMDSPTGRACLLASARSRQLRRQLSANNNLLDKNLVFAESSQECTGQVHQDTGAPVHSTCKLSQLRFRLHGTPR